MPWFVGISLPDHEGRWNRTQTALLMIELLPSTSDGKLDNDAMASRDVLVVVSDSLILSRLSMTLLTVAYLYQLAPLCPSMGYDQLSSLTEGCALGPDTFSVCILIQQQLKRSCPRYRSVYRIPSHYFLSIYSLFLTSNRSPNSFLLVKHSR